MWTSHTRSVGDGRCITYEIKSNDIRLTCQDVVVRWQGNTAFRSFFNSLLADSPFSAFRWETPMWDASSLSKPFEFVLLDEPGLARRVDSNAFAEHFDVDGTDIVVFSNLGGDATMVVPYPKADDSAYGHLAAFVRLAPEHQRDAFWQSVGEVMLKRINDKPVWLSTAGAGVSWLHVRLDDRPKYYGYRDYTF